MQLFQRIEKILEYKKIARRTMAQLLDVPQNTFNRYFSEEHQEKFKKFLWEIHDLYPEISKKWLFFDEGDMLPTETAMEETDDTLIISEPTGSPITLIPPLPLIGLAACNMQGIDQFMPFNITTSPIVLGPRSVAVLASGDSMVPAGIASGQVCYCDPDQPFLPGEPVLLRRTNGKGALKLFLGEGEWEGSTRFQGWLPLKGNGGQQKPEYNDILNSQIDYIAPVICIKRRV